MNKKHYIKIVNFLQQAFSQYETVARNYQFIFVSPAKQKRDICTAFPVSSLSSSSSLSLSSSSSAA